MINFIISEDIAYFREEIIKVVDKIIQDLNLKANKFVFKEFNKEFEKIVNSNIENKIYILDIVIPKKKGTDIAEMIRSNDLDSLIIFITLFSEEYDREILNNDYMFLKFINKTENYPFELYEALYKSLRKKVKHIITIDTKDTFYRFNSNLVTHIYKEERHSVICYGNNRKATVNIPLKQLKEQLDDSFLFSKNCCIVNVNKITNIDKINRLITFDNKDKTDMVSRKYLKDIILKLKNKLQEEIAV